MRNMAEINRKHPAWTKTGGGRSLGRVERAMDAIETLFGLMSRMGAVRYGSEAVSQLDHAL